MQYHNKYHSINDKSYFIGKIIGADLIVKNEHGFLIEHRAELGCQLVCLLFCYVDKRNAQAVFGGKAAVFIAQRKFGRAKTEAAAKAYWEKIKK